MTTAQVDALAEKLGEHGDLVLAMAYLGLRGLNWPACGWATWSCPQPGVPGARGGSLRNANGRNRSGWTEATQALKLAGVAPYYLRQTLGAWRARREPTCAGPRRR